MIGEVDFRRKFQATLSTIVLIIWTLDGVTAQYNIYGANVELVKMRLSQQSFYIQQYQLQVDYTHGNRVIDYGVVPVGGVQDQTDFIFTEAINRNPFHIPRVEVLGEVCFRLFVQNADVLFDECTQIRDLPSNSAYYSSKYITRSKNDGSLLMYKFVQYMVENRDETRNLLEQSFINAQLHGILGTNCPCTAPVIVASFEGAIILIVILCFVYWKFGKTRLKCKSSTSNDAFLGRNSHLSNGIYADNVVTTTSIAWGDSLKDAMSSPSILRTTNSHIAPYYASNSVLCDKNPSKIISGDIDLQEMRDALKLALPMPIFGPLAEKQPNVVKNSETSKRFSKSILDQILSTNKKLTAKGKNDLKEGTIKMNKSKSKSKKIPPDPPPPDYKNYAFEDDETYGTINNNETKTESFTIDVNKSILDGNGDVDKRIYDRLESPQ